MELPPFISIVQHAGRPVILGMETFQKDEVDSRSPKNCQNANKARETRTRPELATSWSLSPCWAKMGGSHLDPVIWNSLRWGQSYLVDPRGVAENGLAKLEHFCPKFFCPTLFCAHPPGHGRPAFGLWMSAPKSLFFQGFEGLPEVFDPGRLHERPRDVHRMSGQKTFSFWLLLRS